MRTIQTIIICCAISVSVFAQNLQGQHDIALTSNSKTIVVTMPMQSKIVANNLVGKWNLVFISDSKNSDFSNTLRSCDKNTVWEITPDNQIRVSPTYGCNASNMNYVKSFLGGFAYSLVGGNTLRITDAPNNNVLDGTMGGSIDFAVTIGINTMTWELIKKARYNDPDYTYKWVFKKVGQAID